MSFLEGIGSALGDFFDAAGNLLFGYSEKEKQELRDWYEHHREERAREHPELEDPYDSFEDIGEDIGAVFDDVPEDVGGVAAEKIPSWVLIVVGVMFFFVMVDQN